MGILAYFAPDDIPLSLIGADVMSEVARGEGTCQSLCAHPGDRSAEGVRAKGALARRRCQPEPVERRFASQRDVRPLFLQAICGLVS